MNGSPGAVDPVVQAAPSGAGDLPHDPLCACSAYGHKHWFSTFAPDQCVGCWCRWLGYVRADEREKVRADLRERLNAQIGGAVVTVHRDSDDGTMTGVTLAFNPPDTTCVLVSRDLIEEWARAMPIIEAARGEA